MTNRGTIAYFQEYFFLAVKPDTKENSKNTAISATTIVAPAGVAYKIEKIIPVPAHMTEIIDEQIITLLKLLNIRIADKDGKIINAEINREPTKFIANTIIKAVIIAINKL